MRTNYKDIYEQISNSIIGIEQVNNDKEMDKTFVDPFMTDEQKNRDELITSLLRCYVNAYGHKVKSNKIIKWIIVIICLLGVMGLGFMFCTVINKIDFNNKELDWTNVIQLLTVCSSTIGLIIGVLKIVVKYVFPENDEEYITRIVEIIQKNDLDNKKENIKVNGHNSEEIDDK